MNEADALVQVNQYFDLTHVGLPSNATMERAYTEYKTLKGSGHNAGQIVNIWKASGLMQPTQAAAFVNAMDQIEKGIPIQDPDEGPSWGEAYDMGLGKGIAAIPWGKLLLAGLAYAFVTQGLPKLMSRKINWTTRHKY